ncbi:MAG: hypothetical protein IPF64_10655 [Flavobacteriales bacterium]|nr:hypothetical protein [Flavobacteriales bacterium]
MSVEFMNEVGSPLRRLPEDAVPPFDFWDYVERIPVEDYAGCNSLGTVQYVYEDPAQRYLLVNLDTDDKNVFMVVVLDIRSNCVHGHLLLDLNKEYGSK